MIVKILNKTTNQHQRSLQKVIAIGHSSKTKEDIYVEYKSLCEIDSDDPDLFKKLVAERLNAYDKLDIIIDLLIEFVAFLGVILLSSDKFMGRKRCC